MSIADTCEESAFEHGRSVAIEGFTTKELTDELSKRDGVEEYTIPFEGAWGLKMVDDIVNSPVINNYEDTGAARILVVID